MQDLMREAIRLRAINSGVHVKEWWWRRYQTFWRSGKREELVVNELVAGSTKCWNWDYRHVCPIRCILLKSVTENWEDPQMIDTWSGYQQCDGYNPQSRKSEKSPTFRSWMCSSPEMKEKKAYSYFRRNLILAVLSVIGSMLSADGNFNSEETSKRFLKFRVWYWLTIMNISIIAAKTHQRRGSRGGGGGFTEALRCSSYRWTGSYYKPSGGRMQATHTIYDALKIPDRISRDFCCCY